MINTIGSVTAIKNFKIRDFEFKTKRYLKIIISKQNTGKPNYKKKLYYYLETK